MAIEVGTAVECLWTQRKGKAYAKFRVGPAQRGDKGIVTAIHELKDITIVIFKEHGRWGVKKYCHIQNVVEREAPKSKERTITIPDPIRAVFDAYGFIEAIKLENAVATRSAEGWFAVLFPPLGDEEDQEEGQYWAIDFRKRFDGDWEIQNDWVGPFKTIGEFRTGPLTLTLF